MNRPDSCRRRGNIRRLLAHFQTAHEKVLCTTCWCIWHISATIPYINLLRYIVILRPRSRVRTVVVYVLVVGHIENLVYHCERAPWTSRTGDKARKGQIWLDVISHARASGKEGKWVCRVPRLTDGSWVPPVFAAVLLAQWNRTWTESTA